MPDEPSDVQGQSDSDQQQHESPEPNRDLSDAGERALKAERDARRKAESAVKLLNARLQELESAGKSDEEQRDSALKSLQERADKAETALREATARAAVMDAAAKAHAVNGKAVFALIRSELEFDDDGELLNLEDAMAAVKADAPELFRQSGGSADGGRSGEPVDKKDMNQLFRDLRSTHI